MIDFTSWIKGSLEINLPEDRIWETSICWSRICLILHRGRGRVCIHWWGWWCKLSWPSTSQWSCRWSGRGQGTGGRNSAGHKNSQTRQRNFFNKALSLQCRSILPKQRPARKQCVWKACQGKWRYSSWAVRSNPRSCCGGWVYFEAELFFYRWKTWAWEREQWWRWKRRWPGGRRRAPQSPFSSANMYVQGWHLYWHIFLNQ